MLGDIGTLRLGEAQVGSDKEYMETGEHTFRYVYESAWEKIQSSKERAEAGLPLFPSSGRHTESCWVLY